MILVQERNAWNSTHVLYCFYFIVLLMIVRLSLHISFLLWEEGAFVRIMRHYLYKKKVNKKLSNRNLFYITLSVDYYGNKRTSKQVLQP